MISEPRRLSLLDRLLVEFDHGLRLVFNDAPAPQRSSPAATITAEPTLSDSEWRLAANLMRVNHSGEIAAQGLYRGQALVARNTQQREDLLTAAGEEQDHLAWCQQRLQQLASHGSYAAPLWYWGAFGIGLSAGLISDRWSLGFLAETEHQVAEHLANHLQRLPTADTHSRAVLQQMQQEELQHAAYAHQAGAETLPQTVKHAMRKAADIMRAVSFRL